MKNKKSVLTIGTFDGVHKGHMLLIKKTLETAKKNNLKSIVIALEKPVKNVSGLLSLSEEKIELIKSFGVDEIAIIPAASDILSLSPDEFFKEILIDNFNACHIVCGSDFAFGKNRAGNTEWLLKKVKNRNMTVDIIKPLQVSSKTVSSSLIRAFLHKNDLRNANKMLGREYSFTGMPFREKGLGAKIGFPTVNLKADKDKILPKGIYLSVISQGDKIYSSVTNIGSRPTSGMGKTIIPETHILGFNGKWSKKNTKVTLIKKIRDEKKFRNIEELKKQIAKDVCKAKKYFGTRGETTDGRFAVIPLF
ncbi:MAG: bifunctional riboflavin kinase/FAD synthetase [Endomicrobia bacterium]|nr:bifunctional riboflavin kinase/FAD synthetase [Endomicrobiia bacterium]